MTRVRFIGMSILNLVRVLRPASPHGVDPVLWARGEKDSSIGRIRPPYPPEFRWQMVELVRAGPGHSRRGRRSKGVVTSLRKPGTVVN